MTLESIYPPVCYYGDHSKQWYIIAGGIWHPVDRQYSWEEIKGMWKKITLSQTPQPKANTKKKTYMVEGSKGNVYEVVDDSGIWTCSCPAHGFGRGKDCKHIKQLKSEL